MHFFIFCSFFMQSLYSLSLVWLLFAWGKCTATLQIYCTSFKFSAAFNRTFSERESIIWSRPSPVNLEKRYTTLESQCYKYFLLCLRLLLAEYVERITIPIPCSPQWPVNIPLRIIFEFIVSLIIWLNLLGLE